MNSASKISFFEMCIAMMLMNGLAGHVIINPMVLDASGRDAWLSVIFASIIFIPWSLILVLVMKRSNQQKLQPWFAEKTNPFISWLLVAPLCLQLYLIGAMTVLHTSAWTITNYLPATPKLLLISTLVLVCYFGARSGLKTIVIASGILLPVVIILGFFVATANLTEKDFHLLTPIMEHGIVTPMRGVLYVGGGFVEIAAVLAMQHRLKRKIKPWQMLVYGIIVAYITLGPIIGGITEFGPDEAAKQIESPYEQWRLVTVGEYIEHVDFLSVYQWLAGASIRICLAQYLLAELLPFNNKTMKDRFIFAVSVSFVLFSMLPISENSFYDFTYGIYFPGTCIVFFLLSLLWLGVAFLPKKSKEGTA